MKRRHLTLYYEAAVYTSVAHRLSATPVYSTKFLLEICTSFMQNMHRNVQYANSCKISDKCCNHRFANNWSPSNYVALIHIKSTSYAMSISKLDCRDKYTTVLLLIYWIKSGLWLYFWHLGQSLCLQLSPKSITPTFTETSPWEKLCT